MQTVHIDFHRDGAIAVATVRGPASADDFSSAIEALARYTRQEGAARALAHCLDTTRKLPLSDHIAIGHRMAAALRHLERVATVLPEPMITRASEKVTASAGLQVRVFGDLQQALDWLRDG